MKISSLELPTQKEVKQAKARKKLINFTRYTMPEYEINWHHERLAHALDQLQRREIRRLMVYMPPRHGKSELVSRRLPAYILGRDPNASIIGTSYSGDLSSSMNRDIQRIIDSPEYQQIFPDTNLNSSNIRTIATGNYLRNSDVFEIVGYSGSYKSSGIGGGITGRGADYAIIDDPVKNRQDAESQATREKIWDWFTSTLYTRLEKDACILITLTRWHEDDLAGRLLRQSAEDPDADDWTVINYPAIFDPTLEGIDETDPREEGDPLWPGKFDDKALRAIKSTIGSYDWSSLYQQTPTPPEGGILQRGWFQTYRKKYQQDEFEEIIQSWDLTFKDKKGSDYVVGQVWGRKVADKYLLDQTRAKMDFPATLNALRSMSAKWDKSRAILVEDKANGPAVISTLRSEIAGIIPIEPEGGKEVRASAISPQLEAGNIYIPSPQLARWVHDFIEECAAFPNGVHDDQVDAMTQGVYWLTNKAKKKKKVKASSV